MKKIIVSFIFLVFLFSSSSFANEEEKIYLINHKKEFLKLKSQNYFYNKKAYRLSLNICSVFLRSIHKKINIKKEVLKAVKRRFVKDIEIKNPTFEQSIKYINKHKNSMMCLTEENEILPFILYGYQDGKGEGLFFLEELVDETFYFEEDEELILNVNAVFFNKNGEAITSLDYLNNLLKSPNDKYMKRAIKRAIDLLKDYNGKRYSELSEEEKKIPIYK